MEFVKFVLILFGGEVGLGNLIRVNLAKDTPALPGRLVLIAR